jgi:hypothetical protein
MAAPQQSNHGPWPNAKLRAIKHLSNLRELTGRIFRSLSDSAKSAKDDAGNEKVDSQREQHVQLLCQTQTQLKQSVADAKLAATNVRRIDILRRGVVAREALLSRCASGLYQAEALLHDTLLKHRPSRNPSDPPGQGIGPALVDVNELLAYSSKVAPSALAAEGWEPGAELSGALPPHPHMELLARSRLFDACSARRPGAAHARRIVSTAGPDDEAPGRRCPSIWADKGVSAPAGREPSPPAKRPCIVPPPPPPPREGAGVKPRRATPAPAGGGDGAWALDGGMPEMPAGWRPGDPILVTSLPPC